MSVFSSSSPFTFGCFIFIVCCLVTSPCFPLISIESQSAILGKEELTLTCAYNNKKGNANMISLEWGRRGRNSKVYFTLGSYDFEKNRVANFFDASGKKLKLEHKGTSTTGSFNLVFKKTECKDVAKYICTSNFRTASNSDTMIFKETNVTFYVYPLSPELTINPDKSIFNLHDEVTFTCTCDVGNPPGFLWWFSLKSEVDGNMNLTGKAKTDVPDRDAKRCSYTRTSTLQIYIISSDHDSIISCNVYNPTLQIVPRLKSSCEKLCRMSGKLSVLSPFYGGSDFGKMEIVTGFLILSAIMFVTTCIMIAIFRCIKKSGEDQETSDEAAT